MKRGEARGTWLESHFTWQIRTFWFAAVWATAVFVLGALLAIVLIGFAIWAVGLFALGIWAIYRIARGWLALQHRASHPVSLGVTLQLNAVPIVCGWSTFSNRSTSRAEAIQLLIKDLPTPGESHSLQDILAFRKEAREQGLIQGLRVWINEMASGNLTNAEVSDKMEDLVSRYERALKAERMTRNTGFVETLVTTTAEIAESLVKFQWSNLAKKLFEVKHRQIDLTKAEMNLPGREVAYIVKARETFPR